MGSLALASLLKGNSFAAESSGLISPLHHAPKVKRVIWLYMAGGMSHLETFDPKPKLAEMNGKPMPESITKGQQIAQLQGAKLNCFAPQHAFRKWGQSGLEFSEIFPEMGAKIADEMCIIEEEPMSFKLPDLPYSHDALAPYMSKETLEYHHDKHHKAYVDNGNKLLESSGLEGKSLEEIVKASFGKNAGLSTMPASITTTAISGNG